jgi:hypothetical protein
LQACEVADATTGGNRLDPRYLADDLKVHPMNSIMRSP